MVTLLIREKNVEQYLKRRVEQAGGVCWKWVSPGTVGVPDRFVAFPGQWPYLIEVKSPGGKLTAIQRRRIEQLRDLGQRAGWVNCYEDVDLFISMRVLRGV